MPELQRTRLYATHVALGARLVPFAGWEMPVQYPSGPLAEHHAVRRSVGLFDIDHMGQVEVRGPDATAFLQRLQVWDLNKMKEGDARYSLACYADGGIVDDLFIYRRPDRWFVVVNASNRAKDVAWFRAHAHGFKVMLNDVSDETYMLALQGPQAQATLSPLCPANLAQMPFHTGQETTVAGVPAYLGATGYTGEYGYEVFFPAEKAEHVWGALLEAGKPYGIIPCGLAARDSLRFEPCLPLYGHEISAEVDPISAGLGWTVSFDKGDFLGRDALLQTKLEGPGDRLVALEMVEKAVPRQGYAVLANDVEVGRVTTGMYAPTADRYVGLAYVPADLAAIGTELAVLVRDKPRAARVVKKPFYTPAYRR
ncbi:MAG: glycine cleavage system aminomethyltransferase GcvT [Anaerolineae bacterium]|nr:glycine cleavage system aminomethyltransferase GcvT [Anaerolineae bacterium]